MTNNIFKCIFLGKSYYFSQVAPNNLIDNKSSLVHWSYGLMPVWLVGRYQANTWTIHDVPNSPMYNICCSTSQKLHSSEEDGQNKKAEQNCVHNLWSTLRFNSLWPRDAIWRQRSWSTLAQVMACCLTAPSHYLNQCWLIISEVQWHSY